MRADFRTQNRPPKRCPPTVGGHLLGGLFGGRKLAPIWGPKSEASFPNFSVIVLSPQIKRVLARMLVTIVRVFFLSTRSDIIPQLLVQKRHYKLSH